MHYEQSQDNVDKGLLEAPPHISDAYRNRTIRYILEALLLDPETPEGVYQDLMGWDMPTVEEYRKYFFNIPKKMPRLELFTFIQSMPFMTDGDIMRKNLCLGVYEYGWAFIDSTYNRGSRVSIQGRAMHSLKKMFGHIDRMVVDCLSDPTVKNLQPLMKLMKEAIQIEADTVDKTKKPEQLTLQFVEDLQAAATDSSTDSSKIMGLEFDELRKLKPVSQSSNTALQTELTEILKDAKDCLGD
jgi:hypothetical protein